MITENFIQTRKTARYYTLGNLDKSIYKIWFVFHGYGQLASEFIKNMEVLKNANTLIIAPEALNKFYLKGFYGKIGATWMTKEDRENEIDNYVAMIENIYHEISSNINLSKVEFNVLGFSQGTHTAVRWLDRTKPRVNNLLLWSGTFPHDCNYSLNNKYWSVINAKIIIGTLDRLIDKSHLENELEFIKQQKLNIELITFKNGHEMNINKLEAIVSKL